MLRNGIFSVNGIAVTCIDGITVLFFFHIQRLLYLQIHLFAVLLHI